MGMENVMFWSNIGSGFGEPGGTAPPRIPRSTTPLPPAGILSGEKCVVKSEASARFHALFLY